MKFVCCNADGKMVTWMNGVGDVGDEIFQANRSGLLPISVQPRHWAIGGVPTQNNKP